MNIEEVLQHRGSAEAAELDGITGTWTNSLGVVAMSADQRQQIERAIETLAKDDEAFAGLLEEDRSRQEALSSRTWRMCRGTNATSSSYP